MLIGKIRVKLTPTKKLKIRVVIEVDIQSSEGLFFYLVVVVPRLSTAFEFSILTAQYGSADFSPPVGNKILNLGSGKSLFSGWSVAYCCV